MDVDPQALERFDALQTFAGGRADSLAIVMRHSIRGPIPLDPDRRDVPLLPAGVSLCEKLGTRCRLRPARVFSSPMRRCTDTARHFLQAGPPDAPTVESSTELGAPGAYVADPAAGWRDYVRWRKRELVRVLYARPSELEGYRAQAEGVRRLATLLLPAAGPALTFAFSHDILMSATLSWLADRSWQDPDWPDFHEGFALWREGDALAGWYRGEVFRRRLAD